MKINRRRFLQSGASIASQALIPSGVTVADKILNPQTIPFERIICAINYFGQGAQLIKMPKTINNLGDDDILELLDAGLGARGLLRIDDYEDPTGLFSTPFVPTDEQRKTLAALVLKHEQHFDKSFTLEQANFRVLEFFLLPEFKGKPLRQYLSILDNKIREILPVIAPRLKMIDWINVCEDLENSGRADAIEIPYQLLRHFQDTLPQDLIPKIRDAYSHMSFVYRMKAIEDRARALEKLKKERSRSEEITPNSSIDWLIEPSRKQSVDESLVQYDVSCTIKSKEHSRDYLNALRNRLEDFYEGSLHATDFFINREGKVAFKIMVDESIENQFLDKAAQTYLYQKRIQPGAKR